MKKQESYPLYDLYSGSENGNINGKTKVTKDFTVYLFHFRPGNLSFIYSEDITDLVEGKTLESVIKQIHDINRISTLYVSLRIIVNRDLTENIVHHSESIYDIINTPEEYQNNFKNQYNNDPRNS